ncbi:hypothetical protein B0T14DRAFT_584277 [Immersiella caudata]|uniref:Uncharacterized protein n=1 Tax=Immersiella caudata TaxID=314043 RepID=A0AA39WP58_9PEZI|nr:hypothetical protein B0T14DRAFT_584277 [Immersiella caudata]
MAAGIQVQGGRDTTDFSRKDDFGIFRDHGVPRGGLEGNLAGMTRALTAMTINDSYDDYDGAYEPSYSHGDLDVLQAYIPRQVPHGSSQGGSSSRPQGHGSRKHGTSSNQGFSKGSAGGNDNGGSFSGDGNHEDGDRGNDEGMSPAQQVPPAPEGGWWGCPLRKGKKDVYTVRRYKKCGLAFSDFHAIKKHLRDDHKEDISASRREKLRDRKGHSKIDTWVKLWSEFFPDWTGPIPAGDYEPYFVVEPSEMERILDQFAQAYGISAVQCGEFIAWAREGWEKAYAGKRLKSSEKNTPIADTREPSTKAGRQKGKSPSQTLPKSNALLMPKPGASTSPTTSDEQLPMGMADSLGIGTMGQQTYSAYQTTPATMVQAPELAAQYGQAHDPSRSLEFTGWPVGTAGQYQSGQYRHQSQHDVGGNGGFQ